MRSCKRGFLARAPIVLLALGVGACGVSEVGPPQQQAAPLPGDTVQIDGHPVARDKVVVFVHVGHSNMAGRATGPAAFRPYFYDADPQLWSFHWQDRIAGNGLPLVFTAALEPTAPDAKTGANAGPGMAILRAARAIAPADTTIVSIGHGQSGSFGGQCTGFRRGGVAYDVAMGPAQTLRGKVTWGGIFVMFGTSEADLEGVDDHRQFGACLAGMAAEMREDLGAPDLPFLIGDWEAGATGSFALEAPTALAVAPQIRMIPQLVARSAVIPSDGLPMEDDHHYNMEGHEGWANRGMAILKQNGWAPWAAP
jgi:hypothetical protein